MLSKHSVFWVALLAFAGASFFGCTGHSGQEKAGSGASDVLSKVAIPVAQSRETNPQPDNQTVIDQAQKTYGAYCANCHGDDGSSVSAPMGGEVPPDMKSSAVQKLSDGQLKYIISYGVPQTPMPAWKGTLTDDDIWRVVRLLRKLPASTQSGSN